MFRWERTLYSSERIWKTQHDTKKEIKPALCLAVQRYGFLTFRVICFRLAWKKEESKKPVLCIAKLFEGGSAFWLKEVKHSEWYVGFLSNHTSTQEKGIWGGGQTYAPRQGLRDELRTYRRCLPLNAPESSGGNRRINRSSQSRLTRQRWAV